MHQNEAIAFIRSRSNKVFVTSHDLRVMNQIVKEPYFGDLHDLCYSYCEPIFFKKYKMVQYDTLFSQGSDWSSSAIKIDNLGHFGFFNYVHINFRDADWHKYCFPKCNDPDSAIEKAINTILTSNNLVIRLDGGTKYRDRLLRAIEKSSAKCINLSFKHDFFSGLMEEEGTLDLSNNSHLKYIKGVPILPLIRGKILLPESLLLLTTEDVTFDDFLKKENNSILDSESKVVFESCEFHSNLTEASFHRRQMRHYKDPERFTLHQSSVLSQITGMDIRDKDLNKVVLINYNSSAMSELICHKLASDFSGTLNLPNLLGYAGLHELLSAESLASVKVYEPNHGLWYLNRRNSVRAAILNPLIENKIIPTMTRLKGMLMRDGSTLKAQEERYGHITTVNKSNLNMGVYMMEMFT